MSDDTLTSLIVEAIGRHLAPIIKWLYGVFAAVIAGTAFIVGMVHEDKLSVADIGTWGNSVSFNQPILASRLAKYNTMVSGDSGSPVFLVHDNKLVLVALVTFGGAGRGANISRHIAAINSAMTSLGGNHQLATQTP